MSSGIIKYGIIILLILGGCAADFHSKKWADSNLKGKPTLTILNNFVDLGFAENRGMVFGILNGKIPQLSQTILIIIRILILIGLTIFIWISKKRAILYLLPFILFWAGAIGNLIDPFTYGYVVDFIHIKIGNLLNWPFYFNLADAYVTIGIILFLINGQFQMTKKESKALIS
jgi:signal peptidase II